MTEADQNRLIIDNMGLVPVIAADYRGDEVEFEDLLAAGREGLVRAARSFDPSLGKFSNWASNKIRLEIFNSVQTAKNQWYPKEDDAAPFPSDSDSIERIYEWDSWGDRGNASAICERWTKLDASPEELASLYEDLKDRRDKFSAAFMSLTGNQRRLVTWVYLDDPPKSIAQAARELGVSYFSTIRMLKKALKVMRKVITRMQSNETSSGGKIANGRPSSTGRHGCASGNVAA